ncbi:hypothetical protein COOONC_05877 [Cooperia oncophora]
MSQIGGQFGFFLGLSIITLLQMILYGIHFVLTTVAEKARRVYTISTSFIYSDTGEKEDSGSTAVAHDGVSIVARRSLDGFVSRRSVNGTAVSGQLPFTFDM